MKLLAASASPFARKCRAAIFELGLENRVAVEMVTVSPGAPGDIVPARNPLGKIPALDRADAPALYDSRVITRYLDDLAGGGLYPLAPRLWDTLTLEATADGIMDAAVLITYEKRLRAPEAQSDVWIENQWDKITRSLDALEERWLSHLNGPRDMAHLACAAALSYLDFRHGDRDWRAGHSGLAKWEAAAAKWPSLAQTVPE